MRTQVADWVAGHLAASEDIQVPIKRLWIELNRALPGHGLTLEGLALLLEADEQFAIKKGVDYGNGDARQRLSMEQFGFWSGPKVRLASRELTLEYVARKMQEANDRMIAAMETGNVQIDPHDAAQLMEVLTMTEQLQQMARDIARKMKEQSES